MDCQSCLIDPKIPIIADASVVINLNASGFSKAILDALPNQLLVVKEVMVELEEGIHKGRKDAEALSTLISSGKIELVQLGIQGTQHFRSLVSGPALETLDDGEAATIASAIENGAVALIDERKANRICKEHFSRLLTGCTLDIFTHPGVQISLDKKELENAVYNALFFGRMRVLNSHLEWVVKLIGSKRAAKCISLPNSARSLDI